MGHTGRRRRGWMQGRQSPLTFGGGRLSGHPPKVTVRRYVRAQAHMGTDDGGLWAARSRCCVRRDRRADRRARAPGGVRPQSSASAGCSDRRPCRRHSLERRAPAPLQAPADHPNHCAQKLKRRSEQAGLLTPAPAVGALAACGQAACGRRKTRVLLMSALGCRTCVRMQEHPLDAGRKAGRALAEDRRRRGMGTGGCAGLPPEKMRAVLAENGVTPDQSVAFMRGFWQSMTTG